MPKQGRNEKCACGSNKKYKFCCINKSSEEDQIYLNGHEISSDSLQSVADKLKKEYNDHKVIDVSAIINEATYKKFQTMNFYDKTFMILEKNDNNETMFKKRGPDNVDIMVLYRGAYTCFEFKDMDKAWSKVKHMIDRGF